MKYVPMILLALLCCTTVPAQPAPAPQQQWGTILGRIVYDGKAPQPAILPTYATRLPDGPKTVADESLVIGKNGGLANVFVYLHLNPSLYHPDYFQTKPKKVLLEAESGRFVPHALALWNKDFLGLRNNENVGVDIKYTSALQSFHVLLATKDNQGSVDKQLLKGESLPAAVRSDILPWMRGNLLVLDNPYFCVTNERGDFCIPNLPVGEDLNICFWHERAGLLKNIKSDVAAKTNDKGLLQTEISQLATNLGEFKIDPALFKE